MTLEISTEMEEGRTLPMHYCGWAERVGGALSRDGAMGVILIDGAPLERIERSYGVQAHRKATDTLEGLVRECCREDLEEVDLVVQGARTDEYVVLFMRERGNDRFYRERLPEIANRIAEHVAANGQKVVYPYERDAPIVPVGSSVIFHDPGLSPERQLIDAFERAREDAHLNAAIARRERHTVFRDLVLAEDVAILYEPIVSLSTREILGHEALVRGPWKTDLHSPMRLFQMAEETGLVFELDCLCRRTALRGARGLEAGRKLFLNCLPTAIHDPAFRGDVLRKTLQDLSLRPENLVFEISERESIDNFAIFREARDLYKELGFKIALDDTGVAYGSLEAIMELVPDFIKVDMSLVRGVDSDPPRQELLGALHAVAGKLGAEIIAEGIETPEEMAALQRLGIPFGQGYLFGRAAPLRRG